MSKKLHLGSGQRKAEGFINVDIQKDSAVDLVADVRDLPYDDNSIDLIYSCSVIEHFSKYEYKKILKYWFDLLIPWGRLEISTMDFEAICKRYFIKGSIEELVGLTVGGSKDIYDRHGMIFDFRLLEKTLREIGFVNIKRVDWRNFEVYRTNKEYDDYARSYIPHMDFNGMLMMLNVTAEKPKIYYKLKNR